MIADRLIPQPAVCLHYALSCGVLALYGTQVCPFIDTLSAAELATPILFTFACLYGIRTRLGGWLESRPPRSMVRTQFTAEIMLFALAGLALAVYNHLLHDFPPGSGLKVVLGTSLLGFFIACDLGLRREHRLALEVANSGRIIEIDRDPYPLTKRFSWFASISVLAMGAAILLVVIKDLVWLVDIEGTQDLTRAAITVSLEVAFVSAVIITYILTIISIHGSNMDMLLDAQRSTLDRVADGELSARVPVASNDEFGVIARRTNRTIEHLQLRTTELGQMRDVTVLALSSLVETRDNETGLHVLRTQRYVKVLAEQLKDHPRFRSTLSNAMIDLLYRTAPLHDIGKVGIPDAILLKPGRLTDREYAIMQQHTTIGCRALRSAQSVLEEENPFLSVACEIIETHHEKWDGSGYPKGLAGEEIPISGRLMALADVYDALISERVYKPAFSHEKAREMIVQSKGTHFDPDVVEAFLAVEAEFRNVAREHTAPEPPDELLAA